MEMLPHSSQLRMHVPFYKNRILNVQLYAYSMLLLNARCMSFHVHLQYIHYTDVYFVTVFIFDLLHVLFDIQDRQSILRCIYSSFRSIIYSYYTVVNLFIW